MTSPPNFTCTCIDGYISPSNNGTNCVENKCLTNNGNCGNYSICGIGSSGSITCSCIEKYFSPSQNGTGCVPNPCATSGSLCGAHSTCHAASSYEFACWCDVDYASNVTIPYGQCDLCHGQCGDSPYSCITSLSLKDCICINGIKSGIEHSIYPCQPINNCLLSNGGCSQHCVMTGPGLSNCSCTSGYYLDSDNVTCNHLAPPPPSSASSVGIGIGVGVGALVVFVLFALFLRRRKSKTAHLDASMPLAEVQGNQYSSVGKQN